MLTELLPLGPLPAAGPLVGWLLMQLAVKAKPYVEGLLQDPTGSISRIGDVLVWQGEKGKRVVAVLEGLTESQARVEQVVGRIETAQIGVAGSLGTLTTLSMATLGVASLSAAFMAWRMAALHQRLNAIGAQISDVQAHLHAQNQAHLQMGLAFLAKYEGSQSDKDLHTALEESTFATNLYRQLVQVEVEGRRRLIALNQCGRYYLLALTAQARCLVLSHELDAAGRQLDGEKPALAALAKTTFDEVMGKSPEVYLDPNLQTDHVTLDLVTEVYQQAHQAGAATGTEVRDAGQMFEHLRPKIYGGAGWFRPAGKAKAALLTKLKYLMACLEEVGRIESLRLRVGEALAGRLSFEALAKAAALSRDQACQTAEGESNVPVVAFACV